MGGGTIYIYIYVLLGALCFGFRGSSFLETWRVSVFRFPACGV